jgi:hypothetical protein
MEKFLMLIILMSNLIFISCVEEEILQEVTVEMKEALVEDNMYTVQAFVDSMCIDLLGAYPTTEREIEDELPPNFRNPFDSTDSKEDVFLISNGYVPYTPADEPANEGRVRYVNDAAGNNDATCYTIVGFGKDGRVLDLYLVSGEQTWVQEKLQEIEQMKEDSVKANMYAVQAIVDSMCIDLLGSYPTYEAEIEEKLPPNFGNPFDAADNKEDAFLITTGEAAYIPVDEPANDGRVRYVTDGTDDDGTTYTIVGFGKDGRVLELYLVSDE